jgi:hypothetical protein
MRLRRLAAAEMVRTPAGAWPGRGFGVLPGGVEADGHAVRLDVHCPDALPSSYRRRSQALLRHDALPGGVGAAQGRRRT